MIDVQDFLLHVEFLTTFVQYSTLEINVLSNLVDGKNLGAQSMSSSPSFNFFSTYNVVLC